MIRSHRRHNGRWSWWPWNRRPTQTLARHAKTTESPTATSLRWADSPTVKLPNLRYAPLLTLGQAYRSNGGRWNR